MQTKTIAAVSAVMFGLGTALMGTTALSQTTTTEDPLLQQQGQAGAAGQAPQQDQAGATGTGDPALQQDQAGAQTGTGDTGIQQDQAGAQTGATDDPLLQQDQAGGQMGDGTGAAGDPALQQDQAGAQTGTGTDQTATGTDQTGTGMAQPGTGTEQPATGMAQDTDPAAPDTGVAQDDTVSPGTGMAADDGLPRRSVGMAAEPYAGEVLAGVTADELIGMNVVDAAGDNVGSINDLLFGNDDQVDHAIVDVGGFLGFGARTVAIPIDELQIAPEQDQAIVNMTREQLDTMPEWQRGDEGWMAN
jgi:sporulation protein YlmC with PRC-barrel domain